MKQIDLSHQKVVAARDIETAGKDGATEIIVREGGVLTPSARDIIGRFGLKPVTANGTNPARPSANGSTPALAPPASPAPPVPVQNADWEKLFRSPEAEKAKEEICAVGKKLWLRSYVDGNGGN